MTARYSTNNFHHIYSTDLGGYLARIVEENNEDLGVLFLYPTGEPAFVRIPKEKREEVLSKRPGFGTYTRVL